MTVIIVDGPEAAGKSTFIANRFPDAEVRKWGPVPNVSAFVPPFFSDRTSDKLVVWDRSWASEVVYNQLLNRGRTPDRIVAELESFRPMRIIIAAPARTLEMRRNFRLSLGQTDDLPVDPEEELRAFLAYGNAHGWAVEWTDTVGVHIDF